MGFCGGARWETGRDGEKEKGEKEGEVEMDLVKDGWRGLRDGQCRQFSLKRTPALHPWSGKTGSHELVSCFFPSSSFVVLLLPWSFKLRRCFLKYVTSLRILTGGKNTPFTKYFLECGRLQYVEGILGNVAKFDKVDNERKNMGNFKCSIRPKVLGHNS